MKEKLILMVKGFILGIANIIPGVSGGTLAITLGIYEQLIGTISHLFHNIKKNLGFIIPIGIGAVLSVLVLSKLINYSLEQFPIPTTLFFIGLIVGGVPFIYRKVEKEKKRGGHIVAFLCTFFFILLLGFAKNGNGTVSLENLTVGSTFLLFLVGVIAAATMVIPGISGSFVLMLLGFYKPILNTISHLTDFQLLGHNMMILIPFGIGIVIGIIGIAKLIEYLLKRHETITYYAILGFILSSVVTLVGGLYGTFFTIPQMLVGILLFAVGSFVGYRLGDE